MTNTSDEFAKVLEGSDTSDADNSAQQVGNGNGTSVTPPSATTFKLGDRELSTEELEKKLKFAEEVEKFGSEHNIDYTQLMPEFTKRSTKLKELETKVEPIEKAFNNRDNGDKEQLPEDYDFVRSNSKKYGLLTEDEVKPLFEKVNALEEKLTSREKEELRQSLDREITELSSAHDFIKRDDLIAYMKDKANAGANLSPQEAARLLYSDQYALIRAKELGYANPNVPQTDASGRSGGSVPAPKKLSFEEPGISDALEESLNTNPVQ